MAEITAARALGWVSLGIAATELADPGWLEKQLGIRGGHRGLIRALGVREAVSGATILSEDRPGPRLHGGLWSRVAGDLMDIALLGVAFRQSRRPGGVTAALAMVLGITALDVIFAERVRRERHQRHVFG